MGLPIGVQDPLKTAFRTSKQSPIGQDRHDLPRRQCRELRLVAVQQDPLAHLVTEAVVHVRLVAISAIGVITSTFELSPPSQARSRTATSLHLTHLVAE